MNRIQKYYSDRNSSIFNQTKGYSHRFDGRREQACEQRGRQMDIGHGGPTLLSLLAQRESNLAHHAQHCREMEGQACWVHNAFFICMNVETHKSA